MEIKDYLPFYLGCKIKVCDAPLSGGKYNKTTMIEYGKTYVLGEYELMTLTSNSEILKDIKLILRPLDDIKYNEAVTIGEDWIELNHEKEEVVAVSWPSDYSKLLPEDFLFLLSKGFDLFGLIDDELAIDATTLPNIAPNAPVSDTTEDASSSVADNQRGDNRYSEEEIRQAGIDGEINSFYVNYLIDVLKRTAAINSTNK